MSKKVTKAMVDQWQKMKEKAAFYKAEEMVMRKAIVNLLSEGSEIRGKYAAENKWGTIEGVVKTNISIDDEELQAVAHRLTPAELDCIKYSPRILRSKLDLVSQNALIRKFITEKPGAPGLTFKPPKKGKK